MFKALLINCSTVVLIYLLSGCGSIITKPVSLATKAVVTPVKAVTGPAVDVVGKPVGKAVRLIKPITPVVKIR
jgi:hypothetical protein